MQAEWQVPADHPAFAGHFPGRPIVPGVVLLDRVLWMAGRERGFTGWTVAQAKFLRPVAPAEMLVFRLMDTPRGALGFEIRCGDELVATGVLQQEVR
ncbi:3-hydroxyacyl-ACP dehydratase FabZ family protein [Hydrogenophaga bisanensis]|uniref:3-hydroxyacyl-ACP dehydratase FabZ family protein n=1 Tax=Hydrogenophaga bisanensis TaxID=439611 RepID=A0ABW2R424_9BURK|nr:hypothetical protein [Hydrogenophaga sp.]MDI3511826.1 3-hydroxyacyl-[acyl-carrier-protein] dehydratase [Betaproteobacteria bacterium]